MVAKTLTHPKTYEDFLKTPDDGQRYELIDGEIVVSPSAIKRHQIISIRLSSWLYDHAVQHKLGLVLSAPMDVRLDRDLVVQPDIIFARAGSAAADPNDPIVTGAPSLVVEILSPSTAVRDMNRKREIYEQYGVDEYWLIDPERKTLTAFILDGASYAPLHVINGLLSSRAVGGFVLDVRSLFADLW